MNMAWHENAKPYSCAQAGMIQFFGGFVFCHDPNMYYPEKRSENQIIIHFGGMNEYSMNRT
jgi:hypothetical protein